MRENIDTVILASGSPRRRELFGMIFDDFKVIVSDCDEIVASTVPQEVTMELSRQKAVAVVESEREKADAASGMSQAANAIVVGADTVVSMDGIIFGKPKDREDAGRMLRHLSGRTHQVSTGLTLLRTDQKGEIVWQKSFSETTNVHVSPLSEEEIDAYLDTDEPYDKAGAYGIQGLFGKHIFRLEGDYNNVVGLPVHKLYEEWKRIESESIGTNQW